ncbi:MAG: Uma2 family endonuclease [Oculatellaceae cyanobacterium Prado106]|jgi:Uma2 family endonuclease|nr:Uma2 family endonuclease [Oculatellaceae cyanobacterium Prado106]
MKFNASPVIYPETDGQPIAESDATRHYLFYAVEALSLHFASRRNIYVSGNLFIYYEEGNNRASISPDVFVIFGVSNRDRRSYKSWQEGGKLPSFILEITSMTTKKQDEVEKPQLYAQLGVTEYFQYDPTADYLNPQLKGFRLIEGHYQPIPLEPINADTSFIYSQTLGLDLQLQTQSQPVVGIAPLPRELRFYDRQTGSKLLSRREVEQALARSEQERTLAEQERDLAQQRAEQLAAQLRALGINPDEISS